MTAEGCRFCGDARIILAELSQSIPLTTREVPLLSDEGRRLAAVHRVPYAPLLFVDGDLFGYGRISGRKLERHLARRAKTPAG